MTEFLHVSGGQIAYDVNGSGPLVVLSPGIGDLRQVYRFLAPQLVRARYRVATPDLRVAGLYLLWLIVSGISLEEARWDEPERTMPPMAARHYLAALPGDRFPNLSAVARELGEPDFDERFEMLIEILVHGLAAG